MTKLKLTLLAGLVLLVGSACATPPDGSDGDLVNQWPAMAAPTIWQPVEGACHNRFMLTVAQARYTRLPCTTPHGFQTVHVGQLAGDAASESRPPESGSASYRSIWNECDTRLTAFIGGQWRERKLRIRLGLPSPAAWEAGARWYTCEASAIDDSRFAAAISERDLKGAFDSDPALRFGCYQAAISGAFTRKSCEEPHNVEFVGFFNVEDMAYLDVKTQLTTPSSSLHRGCQLLTSVFAATQQAASSGTWVWSPSEDDWNAGDRTMRCFLWLNKVDVSKSLKGVGASGWPLK